MPEVKSELILEVGAEGGSIKLLGTRVSNGWHFRVSTSENYGEDIDGTSLKASGESEWVNSWASALGLLDRYPWHRLHPLFVHPEFQKRAWAAVTESFAFDAVMREYEHSYQCPNCKNGLLTLKRGRYGGFIGCTNYPECSFSRGLMTEAARRWFQICFPAA